jgi:hypothetical protein
MRKTPYAAGIVVAAFFALSAVSMKAVLPTLDISGNDGAGSAWRGILNSSQTGYVLDSGGKTTPGPMGENDSQTGQAVADMVGDATHPTVYIGYGTLGSSSGSTTRSVNGATGASYSLNNATAIGFRLRLDSVGTTSSIKQDTWIGVDLDKDGTPDLMIGSDLKQGQFYTVITSLSADVKTGTLANQVNTSPSNTVINYGSGNTGSSAATFLYTYTTTGADALTNYQQVSATNSTVGGVTTVNGDADAFLSFVVPYADFVSAVNTVMGTTYTTTTFDASATFRVTAGTSQQDNNINQDAFGGIGSIYVYTPEMNASGSVGSTINPVPEPASYLIFGALMTPVAAVIARRRWQKRASASLES